MKIKEKKVKKKNKNKKQSLFQLDDIFDLIEIIFELVTDFLD